MKKFLLCLFFLVHCTLFATPFQEAQISRPGTGVDFREVFFSAPTIYSLLLFLSASSVMICLYMLLTARESQVMPKTALSTIQKAIEKEDLEKAMKLCTENPSLFSKMIASGIQSRSAGHQGILDAMKGMGKRETTSLWQKISILGDIAVVAPMIGLLGTVIGMFYAFYDLGRSMESMSSLFDGLGISAGTTVAGLIVALVAMIFYTFLKYRLIRLMNAVEHEAMSCAGRLSDGSHP